MVFIDPWSGFSKYINFEVDEIKYNSSKGACRFIYPNGSSNMTIGIGKCKNLSR
ncbi:hypothetical protein CHBNIV1_14490 [Haemophilus influenzae]|nr:hypothetical protein CHBNIV1_14490 [Haemophilus influenzae]